MHNHLRIEFHCHTVYSKDSLTSVENLLKACRRKGIDRIVITDHNTIRGALRAKELDSQHVIIGEEIMTQQGELLAAFVQEEIPAGLTAREAISCLRDQGAFISVSHPFDRLRSGNWELTALLEITPRIDAIETFNARCIWPGFNREARNFARQQRLPGTVGSDAHALFELGKATMLLPPFHDAESLKLALHQAQYRLSLSAPWAHLASRYAVWWKKITGDQLPRQNVQ